MSNEPTARCNAHSNIAPALGDYTDNLLFGDVWERSGLSPRYWNLITSHPWSLSTGRTSYPFIFEKSFV